MSRNRYVDSNTMIVIHKFVLITNTNMKYRTELIRFWCVFFKSYRYKVAKLFCNSIYTFQRWVRQPHINVISKTTNT